MTGKKIIALVFILSGMAILAAFGTVYWIRGRKPNAGLKIDTTPQSLVFINNRQEGKTPFDKLFKPGDYTVKLIPDSTSSTVGSYETRVNLVSQVYAVINRTFGDTEAATAGETVTLQPQPNQTSLSIITTSSDSTSVTVDDQPQGLTPILISPVTPGDHKILLSAPGFTPRIINVQIVSGYKLQITAKLSGSVVLTSTPTPTPISQPTSEGAKSRNNQITILDTPTGFLRVRSGPGKNFPELGQIKPGAKFNLLSTSSDWYQISVKLDATSSGWISSQYAEKK